MTLVSNIIGLHSGNQPELAHVHTLALGAAFGSGTFGDVYECVAVNGAPPASPLVVKILRNNDSQVGRTGLETIEKLQKKIGEANARRIAKGQPPIESLPALRALPQLSFLGEMSRRQVLGYVCARLDTDGYVPFSTVLQDDVESYFSLALDDRLLLAGELVEGFRALTDDLSFIHADLNPPNLFVNIRDCHLAIIDFDSGAVMDGPDDRPTTFGKRSQWMAPELDDELSAHGAQGAIITVSRLTDAWAVFECIHNLLFTVDSFFFARWATRKPIEDYLRRHAWPEADFADPFCNEESEVLYLAYRQEYDALPRLLREKLEAAVNFGYSRPDLRPSYQQWAMVLQASLRPLSIAFFAAEPASIVAGMQTRLSWSVDGSREIAIDSEIGAVLPDGAIEVRPAADQRYTLTARGRNGDALRRSIEVRVWPVPIVGSLTVPTCRVEQSVVLHALPTAPPRIEVPVTLDLAVRVPNPSLALPLSRSSAARARAPWHLARPPDWWLASRDRTVQQLAADLHRQLMGGGQ